MNQPTRRIIETLVLAATSVFLLGHGGDVPTCFAHASASRTYNVVGTCGPAGVVTVTTTPCSVIVTGDDVGLPSSGNLGATLDEGFDLYGQINSDWDLECSAGPAFPTDAGAPREGAYTLGCSRRPAAGNPAVSTDPVDWCQADLLPVTATCDIRACVAVSCSSAEHTAFGASGCCPTCVPNGPNDIVPMPLPPVCHRETCPQSCPAGQELFSDGSCCSTCVTPPQQCVDGRAQWLTEVEARWSSARSCAQDADCTITSIGSRCESTCNDAIAIDQISALGAWADARSAELCATCISTPASCPAGQPAPARPACSNGTCVMIAL
jgi:hypothetical protein